MRAVWMRDARGAAGEGRSVGRFLERRHDVRHCAVGVLLRVSGGCDGSSGRGGRRDELNLKYTMVLVEK